MLVQTVLQLLLLLLLLRVLLYPPPAAVPWHALTSSHATIKHMLHNTRVQDMHWQ
jgi:hypothetical protein